MSVLSLLSNRKPVNHNIPVGPRNCRDKKAQLVAKVQQSATGSEPCAWKCKAGEKAPELCQILLILGITQEKCPVICSSGEEDPLYDARAPRSCGPQHPAKKPDQQSVEKPRVGFTPQGTGLQLGPLPGLLYSPSREMSPGYPAWARGTKGGLSLCWNAGTLAVLFSNESRDRHGNN